MPVTRCAVVGVGHIGRFHAQKYAAASNAELVAVADQDRDTAERVAAEYGCRAVTDYRALLGRVDAVSIAVPTVRHFEVARAFLDRGTHVLLEKPITSSLEEADELNRIARARRTVFQVGHLERFNAALAHLEDRDTTPLFIESHRLSPYRPRSTDVNVVLDLMIHDLDIILNLVGLPPKTVQASGAKVLSQSVDIANARLEFPTGCVANVTASRVSTKTERKMRIFLRDAYLSIDFGSRRLTECKVSRGASSAAERIACVERSFDAGDALGAQIAAFLRSVQHGAPVAVSGEDGQQALATAVHIGRLIEGRAPWLGEQV